MHADVSKGFYRRGVVALEGERKKRSAAYVWLFHGFLFVFSDERKMKYLGCIDLLPDCPIEPPTQSDKYVYPPFIPPLTPLGRSLCSRVTRRVAPVAIVCVPKRLQRPLSGSSTSATLCRCIRCLHLRTKRFISDIISDYLSSLKGMKSPRGSLSREWMSDGAAATLKKERAPVFKDERRGSAPPRK